MPTFVIRLLEGMFFVGLVGSVLVLILTSIEDVRDLFAPDEKLQGE